MIEIAEILLRAGASVNVSNFSDYSSLQLPPQLIKLSHEVDSIRGNALDIAVLQGNSNMVTLILQYGGKVNNIYSDIL